MKKEKKSVLKTFGAGLLVGGLIGLKLVINIYDAGYTDGVKAMDGDKTAARFHEAALEGKKLINMKLAKK